MSKPHYAQYHRQHLSCYRYRHQQQRREVAEGVIDEDLADGAAGGEEQEVSQDCGVTSKEGEGGGELCG